MCNKFGALREYITRISHFRVDDGNVLNLELENIISDADSAFLTYFVLEQITFCSLGFEKLSNFSVTNKAGIQIQRPIGEPKPEMLTLSFSTIKTEESSNSVTKYSLMLQVIERKLSCLDGVQSQKTGSNGIKPWVELEDWDMASTYLFEFH